MATPKIVPRAQGGGSLGDTDFGWGAVYITNVATSSATAGGLLEIGCNDGAVMADNHRLGAISFKGAEDTSGTLSTGARIQAICRDAWAADSNDADLEFYTTDGTTESIALTLNADNEAIFPSKAQVTTSGLTSVNKRTMWIPVQEMQRATLSRCSRMG